VKLSTDELIGLYQKIKNSLPDISSRIVQFVSSSTAEGVNLIAFEMALLAAMQVGQRILFIDTSMQSNTPKRAFTAALKTPLGLMLHKNGTLSDALLAIEGTNLVYTTLRGPGYDGSTFNNFESFGDLLTELRNSYDLIVISSPAILNDTLSVTLSRIADGSVLVVQAERTRGALAKQVKNIIQMNGGKIIGSILNKRRFYIPQWLYRLL
jgi:Mrp family chromosome partitioning ATPase